MRQRRSTAGAPRRALVALLCCGAVAWLPGRGRRLAAVPVPPAAAAGASGRRALLARTATAAALLAPGQAALGFSPTDLGVGSKPMQNLPTVDLSQDRLKESIYYISRVQEATAQQERLVSTGKFKDTQRNNIKMAISFMLDNYKLNDRIVDACVFIPQDNLIRANQKGAEAVETLQTAQEYFAKDLKVSGLTDEQRTFVLQAMQSTRSKLDEFLTFLPASAVAAARKQVEDENDANLKEYAGEGAIINPIKLPWKK